MPLKALDDYSEALADRRHTFRALVNRGALLRSLGRLEESLADLQEAVSREPRSAQAYNGMGLTLFEMGLTEESIDSFDRAIGLGKGEPAYHVNKCARRRPPAVAAPASRAAPQGSRLLSLPAVQGGFLRV